MLLTSEPREYAKDKLDVWITETEVTDSGCCPTLYTYALLCNVLMSGTYERRLFAVSAGLLKFQVRIFLRTSSEVLSKRPQNPLCQEDSRMSLPPRLHSTFLV